MTAATARNTGLFGDLVGGLRYWHAWVLKAWYDIVLRYRRTLIGPFWMVITTGVMIACLSVIGPALFGGGDPNFIPYLTTGIIAWNFISMSLAELSSTFTEHTNEIQSVRIPFSTYVYRVILRNLVVYVHLLTIYVVVAILFGIWPFWHIPLFLLGVLLTVLNFVWIGFFLGIACARFRDIQQVVFSILMVGFLLTPVFWNKAALIGSRSLIVDLNPLFHFLEVLRAPLLGNVPSAFTYGFLVGGVVIGFAVSAFLYQRYMRRVVFWL